MNIIIAIVLLISFSLPATADIVTGIYQPGHKPADQLQQTLSKLYGEEANIVAIDGQLIIRSDDVTVNQIQELLLQLDQVIRHFAVSISANPTAASDKIYTTNKNNNLQTFTLSEGKTLAIVQQQQEQRATGVNWMALNIESLPSQQEAITITLKAIGNTVMLAINSQILSNGQFKTVSNTVLGELEEWIPIAAQPHNNKSGNSKTTRTQRSHSDELYIRVVEQQ